ncbi:MAG: hypothetical protein ACE5Q3_07390 [Alphaproteobacteria bacterium]
MALLKTHRAVALLTLGVLAGCAEVGPAPKFPELTYDHLAPIPLDVAELRIVTAYQPPLDVPNVEHRAPTAPATAARRWAEDRLIATGARGRRAVFTIVNAAIVESELERSSGLRGLLTTDQSERYDAALEVQLEVFSATGKREGLATASARRSRTVAENITLNERERVWFELTEKLMRDLNVELERSIRELL